VNVEDAPRAGDELDGTDSSFELFEDARCQTDSVRPRASGNAVLDANDGAVSHERMLLTRLSPSRRHLRMRSRSLPRSRSGALSLGFCLDLDPLGLNGPRLVGVHRHRDDERRAQAGL
jgi:hypothetical protein